MLDGPFPPVKAQPDGTFAGLGWAITFKKDKDVFGYFQDGHWHGARAFMKRSPNGVNWAMAFNTTMQPDKADALAIQNTRHEVHDRIERLKHDPRIDLFKEFPR